MNVLNLVWHDVFLLCFCSGSEMQQGTASIDKGGRVSANFECQLLEINFKKKSFLHKSKGQVLQKIILFTYQSKSNTFVLPSCYFLSRAR